MQSTEPPIVSAQSLVRIMIDNEAHATGTLVADNKLVTCLHVLDEQLVSTDYADMQHANNLRIEALYRGERYPCKIIRGDQSRDLVLLEIEHFPAKPIVLAAQGTSPAKDDTVYSLALPKKRCELSQGAVTYTPFDNANLVVHSAKTYSGCSGGALLNDDGQLIGIQALPSAAYPIEWVHDLLNSNELGIRARDPHHPSFVDRYFSATKSYATEDRVAHFFSMADQWPESSYIAERIVNTIGSGGVLEKEKLSSKAQEIISFLYRHMPDAPDKAYRWHNIVSHNMDTKSSAYEQELLWLTKHDSAFFSNEEPIRRLGFYYTQKGDIDSALAQFNRLREIQNKTRNNAAVEAVNDACLVISACLQHLRTDKLQEWCEHAIESYQEMDADESLESAMIAIHTKISNHYPNLVKNTKILLEQALNGAYQKLHRAQSTGFTQR